VLLFRRTLRHPGNGISFTLPELISRLIVKVKGNGSQRHFGNAWSVLKSPMNQTREIICIFLGRPSMLPLARLMRGMLFLAWALPFGKGLENTLVSGFESPWFANWDVVDTLETNGTAIDLDLFKSQIGNQTTNTRFTPVITK